MEANRAGFPKVRELEATTEECLSRVGQEEEHSSGVDADQSRDAPGSPVRAICQILDRRPGVTVSQLRDLVGIGWGTLYDRLEQLQDKGRIEVASTESRKVVFCADGPLADAESPAKALSRLESGTSCEIADAVLAGEATDVESLADATGHSPRVCYYHVRRLIEAGLVSVRRRTRLVNLEPTALLKRLRS